MSPERRVGIVETIKNSILKAPSYLRELRNYVSNFIREDITSSASLIALPIVIIGGTALLGDPHLTTKTAFAVGASFILPIPLAILSAKSYNKNIHK